MSNRMRSAAPAPSAPPQPLTPLLTVRKAAEMLSISRTECYRLVRAGTLPSVRMGDEAEGEIRIPGPLLERWIAARLPEPR